MSTHSRNMDNFVMNHFKNLMAYTCIVWVLITFTGVACSQSDHKSVSQCYDESSIPFVSFYCGANQVIQIERALHGYHKNLGITVCGQLENDCVEDMTSKYDWSKCEGMHSCVQTVQKMSLANCGKGYSGLQPDTEDSSRDNKHRRQYLHVEYNCILSTTEKTEHQNVNKIIEKRMKVLSHSVQTRQMCTNFTTQEKSLILENPGYPNYYSTGTDCRCVIQAPENNKVGVIIHDLSLVKRGKHCIDWLLLLSPNYKDSALAACGLLDGRKRMMESKSNWLLLHFHTARSKVQDTRKEHSETDSEKSMSGFKIQIQSNHVKPLNIRCYTVDPSHIDSIAYRNGQDATSSNLILPASEWEVVPGLDKQSSKNTTNNCCPNRQYWTIVLFFLCASFMSVN